MNRSPTLRPIVVITGTSSGIGQALAKQYLALGWEVIGLSRRQNAELECHESFSQSQIDLTQHDELPAVVRKTLAGISFLDLIILNAGILGEIHDLKDAPLSELRHLMETNVWANKTLLDSIFQNVQNVKQVISISSGAAINGNRGWSGYSISKAALNMLTKLYSQEQSRTHFAALAPGLVDTAMQDYLCELPEDERFPMIDRLKSRRGTAEMPKPDVAAPMLVEIIARTPDLIQSGEFLDVRSLPT